MEIEEIPEAFLILRLLGRGDIAQFQVLCIPGTESAWEEQNVISFDGNRMSFFKCVQIENLIFIVYPDLALMRKETLRQ